MKQKVFHFQNFNQWESSLHYGKQMIGQQGVGLKKLIGAKHHFMHTTKTLILRGALPQGQVLVHPTRPTGGRAPVTSNSMLLPPVDTSGSEWIIWSMITVPTNIGTQLPHQNVWMEFKELSILPYSYAPKTGLLFI